MRTSPRAETINQTFCLRRPNPISFKKGICLFAHHGLLRSRFGGLSMRRSKSSHCTVGFSTFKDGFFRVIFLTHITVLRGGKGGRGRSRFATNSLTILCLSIVFVITRIPRSRFEFSGITPSMTGEKARQMILETSRQPNQALHNSTEVSRAFKAQGKDKM